MPLLPTRAPLIPALALAACFASAGASPLPAQNSAHLLRVGSALGSPGDVVLVRVSLSVPNNAGPVQGFQWSLCHEFDHVRPVDAAIGSGIELSNNGLPPDFHEVALHPGDPTVAGGVRQACIPCFSACAVLTGNVVLLDLSYELIGPEGVTTPLTFCLGTEIPPFPPLPPAVAVGGNSLTPTTVAGTITIVADEEFTRGDADGDGSRNIADAVRILSGLFQSGFDLDCQDAADTNDDGDVNIADAIFLLGFLFLQGAPPPFPFASCGLDPTADPLDCALHPAC